jgi:hypothetical protein
MLAILMVAEYHRKIQQVHPPAGTVVEWLKRTAHNRAKPM